MKDAEISIHSTAITIPWYLIQKHEKFFLVNPFVHPIVYNLLCLQVSVCHQRSTVKENSCILQTPEQISKQYKHILVVASQNVAVLDHHTRII